MLLVKVSMFSTVFVEAEEVGRTNLEGITRQHRVPLEFQDYF